MLSARQWSTRYVTPIHLQALPRNRRPMRPSFHKSPVGAVNRGMATPGFLIPNLPPNADVVKELPAKAVLPSSRDTLIRLLEAPLSERNKLRFASVVKGYIGNDRLMSNVGFCELFAQTAAYFCEDTVVMRIMEIGRLRGVTFTSAGYENVLRQWIRHSKWDPAHRLSELVIIETPSLLSPRIVRLRAQALAALRMYDSLRELLELHSRCHIPTTRRLYNVLIRASLEAGDMTWTRSLIMRMEVDGFAFDATTYSSMLAGYRALGPDAAVEYRIYRDLRRLGLLSNYRCLNALMRSRLDAGDFEGSRMILKLFRGHADPSEVDRMYEQRPTLLDEHGYVKGINMDPFPPTASTSRTPSSFPPVPVAPEISTFNILLSQCAKLGDIERAVTIWNRILVLGLAPTSHTVVAVVRNLLAQQPFRSAQAQAITFVASVAYGAESNRAAEFCERLQARFATCEFNLRGVSVQLSTPIFNTLMSGILQRDISRGLRRMEGILEEMALAGIDPSAETLSIFLKHLEQHAVLEPDEVSTLTRELTERPSPLFQMRNPSLSSELPPAVHVHAPGQVSTPALRNTLASVERLSVGSRSITHRTREVEAPATPTRLAGSSRGSSWWHPKASPSAPHVSPRLHTSASSRTIESGVQAIASSPEPDTRVDANCPETWTHLIRRASSPQAAQANFDHMRARGFIPKTKQYVALMQSYARAGHVDQAARVLASAMAAGILTSIAMFTVLIVAYGSLGRPEFAHHAFNQMRKQPHLSPDVASIDALARAYIRAGRAAEARNVILEHWADADKRDLRRAPEFMDRLRALTLKSLMYALSGLSGAQRKGGRKSVSQARRIATRRVVRRVVQRWKGNGNTPEPKKPGLSRKVRNIATEEIEVR